jgi:hypothetical protein
VAWGGLHGAALAAERGLRARGLLAATGSGRWIRRIVVFQFVCLSWIFFRAPTFSAAATLLAGLKVVHWEHVYGVAAVFLAICAVPLLLVDLELERANEEYLFERHSHWLRIGTGLLFLVLITLFAANEQSAFIYFQF